MRKISEWIELTSKYLEDSGGLPQTVSSLSNKSLYYFIVIAAGYIKYSMSKDSPVRARDTKDTYYLECIELCEVPIDECGEDKSCSWWTTTKPLPNFSGAIPNKAYLSINGGSRLIDYSDPEFLLNKSSSIRKYRKTMSGYMLKKKSNGTFPYFKFEAGIMPESASFEAMFTNPLDLIEFSKDKGSQCNFLDNPLEFDPKYELAVFEKVYEIITRRMRTGVEQDIIDDDIDGSAAPRQQIR